VLVEPLQGSGSITSTERKKKKGAGHWALVAHTYNPSYSGGRRRVVVRGQPRENTSPDRILKKPITNKG
jgi:hypothetical protein